VAVLDIGVDRPRLKSGVTTPPAAVAKRLVMSAEVSEGIVSVISSSVLFGIRRKRRAQFWLSR
jgi:hypothetical protein